jgi:hypothetical protein
MTLGWPNLVVGAVLGFVPGFLAHWAFVEWEKRSAFGALEKAYGPGAGYYTNYLVREDGTEEATDGTIKLLWEPEGSFKALGLRSNGVVEWQSVIEMNLKSSTGMGVYREIGSRDHGIQQVTYLENARLFNVATTVTSRASRNVFNHRWKPKVTP